MRIGIIGAGNMGATLAGQLTQAGHLVAIANSRGPQTLTGVAAQTGAAPVPITDVPSNVTTRSFSADPRGDRGQFRHAAVVSTPH